MNNKHSRRWFLSAAVGTGLGTAIAPHFLQQKPLLAQSPDAGAVTLKAMRRTLDINGKAANVLGLIQPNGTQGLYAEVNQDFKVLLENTLTEPTSIHWHGLHPPNNQDGVPGVTQPLIQPNSSDLYNFPLLPAGTHWMHSHQGLQEVVLLSAPLIVRDPAEKNKDEQEMVMMLNDYSFTPPAEIFAKLRQRGQGMSGMQGMQTKPDANDVDYDAYLANDRTLTDPEVVKVEKGGRVRLRIINGSSGTNYFIDLGTLAGELIATDGMPVQPMRGSRFPLTVAQRIDLLVQLPKEGGAFPILALREASVEQTGIVLTTPGAQIKRLPNQNSSPTDLLNLDLERRLVAANPLPPKPMGQEQVLNLQGNMMAYTWDINGISFDMTQPQGQKPQVRVKPGERGVIKFVNSTGMSHPMHLHGHSFQVIAINDQNIKGALRDTVLVPGKTSVTVAFDANNPGLWFVHCHLMWHLEAGMAALLSYEA